MAAESLYRDANTLLYADNKPSEEAIDRVVAKLNREYVMLSSQEVLRINYIPIPLVLTRRSVSQGSATRKRAILHTSTNATEFSTRRSVSIHSTPGDVLITHALFPDCALLRQVYSRDSCQLRAWYSTLNALLSFVFFSRTSWYWLYSLYHNSNIHSCLIEIQNSMNVRFDGGINAFKVNDIQLQGGRSDFAITGPEKQWQSQSRPSSCIDSKEVKGQDCRMWSAHGYNPLDC